MWVRAEVGESSSLISGMRRLESTPDLLLCGDSLRVVSGLLKIYLSDSTDSICPRPGEQWLFRGRLYPVRNSGNPGAPDFEQIMHRRKCWYRLYCDDARLAPRRLDHLPVRRTMAHQLREKFSLHWKGQKEDVSLLKAVCLGDRSDLSGEMKGTYSGAGGMHLLAVSGLHIGLIWWVLHHGLFWLARMTGREVWRAGAVLLILWGYAYLTGFSSSVCRCVTMFSFFTLGRMIERQSHPVNAILVSAIFLLVISPERLFEVGFQLSYSAILGIAALYPALRRLLHPSKFPWKWLWGAAVVSFSAQLCTSPLVIHYFHQIPLYALLTSLWAIPLLSLLIALFVVSVPFILCGISFEPLNQALLWLSGIMNRGMDLVAGLPGAVVGELHLDGMWLAGSVILLYMGISWLYSRSRALVVAWTLLLSLLLLQSAGKRRELLTGGGLMIPHFYGNSQISVWNGSRTDHYRWIQDTGSVSYLDQYLAQYWKSRHYRHATFCAGDQTFLKGQVSECVRCGEGIWLAGNDEIGCLVIRGGPESFHPGQLGYLRTLSADLILFSAEPFFERIPALHGDLMKPKKTEGAEPPSRVLVADGSNRRWYTESVSAPGVTIHSTYRQGAFLKRW